MHTQSELQTMIRALNVLINGAINPADRNRWRALRSRYRSMVDAKPVTTEPRATDQQFAALGFRIVRTIPAGQFDPFA